MRWWRAVRCGAVVLLAVAAAQAAPAPWYWWVSRYDGQRVCAQFMPEQGWQRGGGPFRNAQCQAAPVALPR